MPSLELQQLNFEKFSVSLQKINACYIMLFLVIILLLDNEILQAVSIPPKPKSKIMEAVDALRCYMNDKGFGLCAGCAFIKVPESKYTYIYYGSVAKLTLKSLKNYELANVITPYVTTLCNLLSQPDCQLIEQITIDFNYIEVDPYGYCFDIKGKCFVKDPKDLHGSPRAYVKYNYYPNKKPDATKFIAGK